jgi:hypothetical protein
MEKWIHYKLTIFRLLEIRDTSRNFLFMGRNLRQYVKVTAATIICQNRASVWLFLLTNYSRKHFQKLTQMLHILKSMCVH